MAKASYQLESNKLSIDGLLSVETVNAYYHMGLEALERQPSLEVNLERTEIIGSAGIALLIAWQRRAKELGKDYVITNPPSHFLDMAKVSGVLEILPFERNS